MVRKHHTVVTLGPVPVPSSREPLTHELLLPSLLLPTCLLSDLLDVRKNVNPKTVLVERELVRRMRPLVEAGERFSQKIIRGLAVEVAVSIDGQSWTPSLSWITRFCQRHHFALRRGVEGVA